MDKQQAKSLAIRMTSALLIVCLILLTITACSDSQTTNPQDLAQDSNNNNRKSATQGETVTLSASELSIDASNTAPEQTLTWSIISKPDDSSATLTDTHNANPSFVADVTGDYVLQLIISNGETIVYQGSITVTVDIPATPTPEPSAQETTGPGDTDPVTTDPAVTKPETHVASTDDCAKCHVGDSWTNIIFDHSQTIGNCMDCHDLPSGHITISALGCDVCHTTTQWKGSSFDHSLVSTGCSDCHSHSSSHINTTNQCESCHADSAGVNWLVPISGVDHTQVIGDCIDCHILPPMHRPATNDCATCHVTNAWLTLINSCSNDPAEAGSMEQTTKLTSDVFPTLDITYSTTAINFTVEDQCVPVFLQLTNSGTEVITLTEEQAASLSDMSLGLYGSGTRIFVTSFITQSGAAINAGDFLQPGESTYFTASITRTRLELYSLPVPGGGIVQTAANQQGPFNPTGLPRLFSLKRFDITYDVDFGSLPISRISESGAGTSFVAGEVIVGFNSDVTLAQAEEIVRMHNCHIHPVGTTFSRYLVLDIPLDKTTTEMIDTFLTHPEVRYGERNNIVTTSPGG